MPVIPVTNLLANQVPGPISTSGPFFRASVTSSTLPPGSSYSPFVQGQVFGGEDANKILVDFINTFLFGGAGYSVSWGLNFNTSNGLQVFLNPGTAIGPGPLEFPNGAQIVLPDNMTSYIYLDSNNTLDYRTVLGTVPPTAVLFLGTATMSGGALTVFDNSGIIYNYSGVLRRFTADRSAPSDSPTTRSLSLETVTQAGVFRWDGTIHRPVGVIKCVASISATFTMQTTDVGFFFLNPTGSTQVVTLPANPNLGDAIWISNTALTGGNNLQVKDHSGSILLCTLSPGYGTGWVTSGQGGSSSIPAYPNATITPVQTSP